MKIIVLGGGLAALGALEHLLAKPNRFNEIQWIFPKNAAELSCSYNSTAVLALQGIEKGVSPLGDDLFDAYFSMKEFIEANSPEGITHCSRYHLKNSSNEDKNQKLESRFKENFKKIKENDLGFIETIVEDAYCFSPLIFMNWWHQRIFSSSLVNFTDDLILGIDGGSVHGQKSLYSADVIINATGSFGITTGLVTEKVKTVPGHYFVWYSPQFENQKVDNYFLKSKSIILTFEGENLIYHSEYNSEGPCLIWGGSSESDGLMGPRIEFLETKLLEFFNTYPQFKFSGQRELFTGVRTKGPKRRPIISREGKVITMSGLYKNGYSLGYYLGKKALESLN